MALKRRVEVLFDAEKYEKLERIAHIKRQSVAALIRKAVEEEYLQPELAEKRRAVEELLHLNIPVGTWEEVKEALVKERSRHFEAP